MLDELLAFVSRFVRAHETIAASMERIATSLERPVEVFIDADTEAPTFEDAVREARRKQEQIVPAPTPAPAAKKRTTKKQQAEEAKQVLKVGDYVRETETQTTGVLTETVADMGLLSYPGKPDASFALDKLQYLRASTPDDLKRQEETPVMGKMELTPAEREKIVNDLEESARARGLITDAPTDFVAIRERVRVKLMAFDAAMGRAASLSAMAEAGKGAKGFKDVPDECLLDMETWMSNYEAKAKGE